MAGEKKELFQDDKDAEKTLFELVIEVRDQVRDFNAALKDHIKSDEDAIVKFMKAFPGEDPVGHRIYHEAEIKWIQTRNELVKECLINAAKVGFVAGLFWIGKAAIIAAFTSFASVKGP